MSIFLKEGESQSLAHFVPYEYFHENFIIMRDTENYGYYGAVVFELSPINYELYTDEQLENLQSSFAHILNTLDLSMYIQFIFKKHQYYQDVINEHLNLNESDKDYVKDITNHRIEQIEADCATKKVFRISLYAVISKRIVLDFNSSLFSSIIDNRKASEQAFSNTFKALKDIRETFAPFFQRAGFRFTIPDEKHVQELCASQINGIELRDFPYKDKRDLIWSDQRDFFSYFTLVSQKIKYIRVITFKVKHPPESTIITIINHLLRRDLNYTYDVVCNIKQKDKFSVKAGLKRKKKVNYGLKHSFIGDVVDDEREMQEQDTAQLIRDMASNKQNMFQLELLIVVKADSIDELERAVKNLISSMRMMEGAIGLTESFANFRLWLNTLPGNGRLTCRRHIEMHTSYITNLIPIFGPPVSMRKAVFMFRTAYDTINGIDPYNDEWKNRLIVVTGSPGAGKSFFVNGLCLSSLSLNPIIFIIDQGGSYKKMIESIGGQWSEITTGYSINLFQTSRHMNEEEKSLYYQLTLEALIEENGYISTDKKIVLEDALRKVDFDTVPIISTFVDIIRGMGEYEDEMMNDVRLEVIRHLDRWTKGTRGNFLNNRTTTFNPYSDIVGLDLKGIVNYPDMMKVFMLYLTTVCWDKLSNEPNRKKVIAIDEAWQTIANKEGARLIEGLNRTARKYNGIIVQISQALKDFNASGILDFISTYFLLEQAEGTDFKALGETLSLQEKAVKRIQKLKSKKGYFGEVFIKTPDGAFVGRYVPSPVEYWYATTDPVDRSVYEETLRQFDGNVRLAVSHLAKKFPHGAFHK